MEKFQAETIEEYAQSCRQQISDNILSMMKDEYINETNRLRQIGFEERRKWKHYIHSKKGQEEYQSLLEGSEKYQMLLAEQIYSDPVFIEEYKNYCEAERKKYEKKLNEKKVFNELKQYVSSNYTRGENGDKFLQVLIQTVDMEIESYFSNECVYIPVKDHDILLCYADISSIKMRDVMDFCENYNGYIRKLLLGSVEEHINLYRSARKILIADPEIEKYRESVTDEQLYGKINSFVSCNKDFIIGCMEEKYTLTYTMTLINTKNKLYAGKFDKCMHYEEMKKAVHDGMLLAIPENYIDFFPLARMMHRKFILHIGGTNSGKTYSSIEAMKKAGDGIYLGPLRLLAAEQYEKLNREGYPCTLHTGEEKKEVPDAKFSASTIEMLNFNRKYSVAVIDEAQMISDRFRGGAWTNALLGILADEIHVCAAPQAENLLKKIIESCGDEYSIQYHERSTELIFESDRFRMEKDKVQKGDAFIVFSKKNVHAVANDLKMRMNLNPSIIYGALPYDVRQNEADKFLNGITDVVVTTDAVGVGMNLPIRRIVFLESSKYDGRKTRLLLPEEVKQIAGRAGRFGIFDKGYVTSYEETEYIRKCIDMKLPDIKCAFLRFPENLAHINGSLSYIISQWKKMKVNSGFQKADVSHEEKLCEVAEKYTDDKNLIYGFITIPFDDNNEKLFDLWLDMLKAKLNGIHLNLKDISPLSDKDVRFMNLQELEDSYKVCDLIFYYNEKFEDCLESPYVMEEKEMISKAIIKWLDEHEFPKRQCKRCGRYLPWHSKSNICSKCRNLQA